MSEKLVAIKNIYFNASNKVILKDVSFDIARGDFITIVGPNGAGKTSLLKILLGNLKATKGQIIKAESVKFGYVPQKLVIDKTIPISVEYFLKLDEKVNDLLLRKVCEDTKIETLLQKQMHVLSGGEMQRVLLAKALLNKPDLLILDEPAQNLDISGQLRFYELLAEIYKKQNIAILMVSHDLHMVMSSTKQVICLFNHICCLGEPEKITKNPEFISIFGNDMAKLISIYNHYHNHKH